LTAKLPPPPNVASKDLFLRLCEWPRPTAPLRFRFEGSTEPLRVRAITSLDWLRATGAVYKTVIVAAALTDDAGVPVFRDGDHLARCLNRAELDALFKEIVGHLHAISPSVGRCDRAAWDRALIEGAKACWPIARAMSLTRHRHIYPGLKKPVVYEPDPHRYFGGCGRELLDGHLMAYEAGVEAWSRLSKAEP